MTVSTPPSGNPTVTWTTADDAQRAIWLAQMEADYCAGLKGTRQIGKDCGGLSHTRVAQIAKEKGWVRDLNAKIQAKAEAKVAREAVAAQLAAGKSVTESTVVEANATTVYQVRIDHRKRITEGHQLWDQMVAELKAGGLTRETIDHMLSLTPESLTAKQRDDIRATLVRAGNVNSRISSFNSLVHSLERLINMERQAYGIAKGEVEGIDNPAHPASQAAAHAAGHGRGLTDAERAIRLARLFKQDPALASSVFPMPAAAPAVPVPPGRE